VPRYATVVFDCDSTLSSIEGIDELAAEHRAEIVRLTDAAMRGEVALEEVYGRRLALIRPTRAQLDALGRLYVDTLVPDARETVGALQAEGVDVRVISGGLLPAVRAAARACGVPDDRVAAVDLSFDDAGAYAGFDAASPLARSGGKLELLRAWGAGLARPAMLVGDGATDLEGRPAVDCFVAFAGVVARDAVVAGADAVVRANSLAPVLALALGDAPPTDPARRALYEKGLSALGPRPSADRGRGPRAEGLNTEPT
jgi:phosphoserine phosphatase